MYKVRETACSTCIYRDDTPLNLAQLEKEVEDEHMGFETYRACHHHDDGTCCRGFWNRHKDEFAVGQVAQRLNAVEFSNEGDIYPGWGLIKV